MRRFNGLFSFVLPIVLWICVNLEACSARSALGTRILVALDSQADKDTVYSTFLGDLESRGFDLSYNYGSKLNPIFKYGQRTYDHLLLLNPHLSDMGGVLAFGTIIDFINEGGNVLLATDSSSSDTIRNLAIEFSVDFDEQNTIVRDQFNSVNDIGTVIKVTNFDSENHLYDNGNFNPTKDSIVFSGIAHRLTGRNAFVRSVASANYTALSYDIADFGTLVGVPMSGEDISIASVLQARNNARVGFVGSTKLFSNEYFKHKGFKNKEFAESLTKFVFQESGVIRQVKFYHHNKDEDYQKGIYLIKENVEFELTLEQWDSKNNKWVPFLPEDIQLDITMLDPHIRKTFKNKDSKSLHIIEALPDVYGVFTYRILYRRKGYSYIEHDEQVQIRPLRHDQYPRFLPHAWPYYFNVWSLFGGFWIISAATLLHSSK